ncbi:hypothetical protein LTR10_000951 [Elasticomyces elasticus]|nr:hypothetical protein LTR10_000951 [Elasticomyces elasticus]KAK4979800.1 hypothetical protein LTR42_000107 [Elasticomyces elasticus]
MKIIYDSVLHNSIEIDTDNTEYPQDTMNPTKLLLNAFAAFTLFFVQVDSMAIQQKHHKTVSAIKSPTTTALATLHISSSAHTSRPNTVATTSWDPNGPIPTYSTHVAPAWTGKMTTLSNGFVVPDTSSGRNIPYECSDQWDYDHPGKCVVGVGVPADYGWGDCKPKWCHKYYARV